MSSNFRPKYVYPIHCKTCFKKLGVSPHNFADKQVFCDKECYIKGDKRREQYWRN